MLKPYVCVVCEKVIIAKDEVPSLIGLFTKLTLAPFPGQPVEIPKNAVSPKEWYVYSSWLTEPGDERRQYDLCTLVECPDKTPFGNTNKTRIPIELGKRAQMMVQMLGFPIGQVGNVTVSTWIEESGQPVLTPIKIEIEVELNPLKS